MVLIIFLRNLTRNFVNGATVKVHAHYTGWARAHGARDKRAIKRKLSFVCVLELGGRVSLLVRRGRFLRARRPFVSGSCRSLGKPRESCRGTARLCEHFLVFLSAPDGS